MFDSDRGTRPDVQPAPTPCLWSGCPLLLWHVGTHAPAIGDARCTPRTQERGGRIVYWNVRDVHAGSVAVGQHAEVAPSRWIRLFGSQQGVAFERVFAFGDEASYHGDDLTRVGLLTDIEAEGVSVRAEGTTVCLSIGDFLIHNRGFHTLRSDHRAALASV